MTIPPEEQAISDRAVAFARKNKRKISREVADKTIFLPEESPVSVFMSGSPGAGKTETSKELISSIATEDEGKVLRLDPDELRDRFEEYDGSNSHLFQGAVSILIANILDHTFKHNQSFLLDGTLSSYPIAEANINRSLKKNRTVLIIFVYQRPELAWQFVQAREKTEGRKILPEHFVEQFFGSQEVVENLKKAFGSQIQIDLLIKDNDGRTRKNHYNVSNIQTYLTPAYTKNEVRQIVGIHD